MARGAVVIAVLAVLVAQRPVGAAVAWPVWIAFDSPDHDVTCPPPVPEAPCVAGYILEFWPQSAVGQQAQLRGAWAVPRDTVTLTGLASPRYQMPAQYCCWSRYKDGTLIDFVTGAAYVWTLRAYGPDLRTKSARSAPTADGLVLVKPAPVFAPQVQ